MDLEKIRQNAIEELAKVKNLADFNVIYKKYLGRKSALIQVLRSLKDLPEKERKQAGKQANQLRQELESIFAPKKEKLKELGFKTGEKEWIDVTAPGIRPEQGHLHPITLAQRELEKIFQSMGFSVIDGPEMESGHYNFDALNIPKNHPARDRWDTLWLKNGKLLRTHTSPMQARYMEKHNPPLRIIVPGRCFRREATDANHEIQFYQTEGLMVGENVSVVDFKGVIETFLKRYFGKDVEMRIRPSFFPFTEPSFEVDMKHKGGKWLEIMGAGMVHQNVFKAVGYASSTSRPRYQGFAFGIGLDRLAMLKYKIDDIRLFYNGDLRLLKQF